MSAFILLSIVAAGLAGCSRTGRLVSGNDAAYSWPMFGGEAGHRNYVRGSFPPPLTFLWREKISATPTASSISYGNTVFVATNDGQVHVFDAGSGEKKSAIKRREGMSAAPLFAEMKLIIGYESGGNTLAAYDAGNGGKIWERKCGPIHASPVYHGGRIILAAFDGTLYSLRPSTGDVEWRWKGSELFFASPAARDTMIIAAGLDGTLTALNTFTGDEIWQTAGTHPLRAAPVIAGNAVYAGGLDGALSRYGLYSGAEEWTFKAGNKIYSTPACDDELVIFGSNDGSVYALRQESGELAWSFRTGGLVTAAPLIIGDFVYIGSHDNRLYALRRQTGEEVWSYTVEGQILQQPLFTGGLLIVSTNRKLTFAFARGK